MTDPRTVSAASALSSSFFALTVLCSVHLADAHAAPNGFDPHAVECFKQVIQVGASVWRRKPAADGPPLGGAGLMDQPLAPIGVLLAVIVSEIAVAPYQLWRKRLQAYHRSPRAVAMLRALSASAISRSVRAPAFWASRIKGRTLAAYLSALPSRRPRRSCGPVGAWGYQASSRTPFAAESA
jgi:hypothetical protein